MRVRIAVDADWVVKISCAQTGEECPTRAMRQLDDGAGGYYPLPPAGECDAPVGSGDCLGLCLSDDPAQIKDARDRITNRRAKAPLAAFGSYLFHCLIGGANWDWIRRQVDANQPAVVELALCWASGDGNLNRLNWEFLHDGTFFLAKGLPGTPLAITRLVAGTAEIGRWAPREMTFPPRVLFVFGTSLNDPDVRPGAEFLGLMRQIKRSGYQIRARVVEKTSPTKLGGVVESFQPDVVHFICHGDWDRETGRGYLELESEEAGVDRRRFADQLVASMSGYPPGAVVLSACHTGSAGSAPPIGAAAGLKGVHETAPLATELIQQGIPIVLAMAGRIADRACRLFTRSFGEALILGSTLVGATAEARRASLAEGDAGAASVDWAFPALFLAEAVPEDFAPVTPGQNPYTPEEKWIDNYNLKRDPVFCGRGEFFQAFHGLFQPGGGRVLAVPAEDKSGVGKTRLVLELAIETLRSGHVPVLIASDAADWTPPTALADLARALRDGIKQARDALGLPRDGSRQLAALSHPTRTGTSTDLDLDISEELEDNGGVLTPAAVRLALQRDLFRLAKDARAEDPKARPVGRAVVLMDSVDRYGEKTTKALFDLLGPHGLGDDEPVPVILVFAMAPPANTTLQSLLERFGNRPWFRHLDLKPFADNDEALLAYQSMLLNPRQEQPPYVINDEWVMKNQTGVDLIREWLPIGFADLLPRRFADLELFQRFTEKAARLEWLIEADDDKLFAQVRSTLGVDSGGEAQR